MLLIKYENDVVPHSSICPANGMTVGGCYTPKPGCDPGGEWNYEQVVSKGS